MKGIVFACLLLGFSGLAFSAPFDRLFTSPSERATLDYIRQTTKIVNEAAAPDASMESPAPVTPENISVQGYVKRSDGKKGTVWVNNRPLLEESNGAEIQVGKLPNVGNAVPLVSDGKSLHLKAGQSYQLTTGTVDDDLAKPSQPK